MRIIHGIPRLLTIHFEYPVFNWGSFDGSTNPPVVFPEGTSLAELEAQVLEGVDSRCRFESLGSSEYEQYQYYHHHHWDGYGRPIHKPLGDALSMKKYQLR
jgi:hypothetical protein